MEIRKAGTILGKTLTFTNANVADSEFILSLRLNPRLSKNLSATSTNLEQQVTWMNVYASTKDQAYFIIRIGSEPIGTVRLYDAQADSFCWGSWILIDSAPAFSAIESALMVYSYAFDHLKFSRSHFDVRKLNKSVWQFHERFGAKRASEDTDNYYFTLSAEVWQTSKEKYRRYLPSEITVAD